MTSAKTARHWTLRQCSESTLAREPLNRAEELCGKSFIQTKLALRAMPDPAWFAIAGRLLLPYLSSFPGSLFCQSGLSCALAGRRPGQGQGRQFGKNLAKPGKDHFAGRHGS